MTLTNLAIGGAFGALVLLPYIKAPVKALALNGYVCLAMMLMIYVGAHLASEDYTRLVYETGFSIVVLCVAGWCRKHWPPGIAFLILGHGAYDFFHGHDAGVMEWYPAVCVGFDVVVGVGLLLLMLGQRKQLSAANKL
jgi:integral membrane sensor domain MASE1